MNAETEVDEFARLKDGSTLLIQRWLPGPVDRIWSYLTESEKRSKWLAAGEMSLMPGSPLELVWRNDNLSDPDDPRPSGFDEEMRMQSQVIDVDPMRRLVIGWGDGDVTFELEPKGDRVLLTLTHRGLDDPSMRSKVAAGWHTHLDILGDLAAGRKPQSFWSSWAKVRDIYSTRLSE